MCRLLRLLLSGNRAFRQRALGGGYLLLHRLFSNKSFFTVGYDRTRWLLYLWLSRLLYLLLRGNRAFRQRALSSGNLLLH